MAAARHKHVRERGPRGRLARSALVLSAATLVTGTAVGVTMARGGGAGRSTTDAAVQAAVSRPSVVAPSATPSTAPRRRRVSPYLADRDRRPSRTAKRVTLEPRPAVTGQQYRTANLNLWPAPEEKGAPITVLDEGGRVSVTGVRRDGFAQILYRGQVRWVNADYLSDTKPKPTPPAAGGATGGGVSSAPCPDGSGTESGLTSSAVRLFRSACSAFPALSSYGGYDAHGEHSTGKAIDFMTSDPALGQALADWARAHASELDLYDVIWQQHIWTPVRAGEGWRSMPDRGSATANHYDHVHISVN